MKFKLTQETVYNPVVKRLWSHLFWSATGFDLERTVVEVMVEVWLPLEETRERQMLILNHSCSFISSGLYQMSIPESASVDSVVGRIWAKDRDTGANAEMKYSIIDGDGRDTFDISTDPTNLFGIITVKKVYMHIFHQQVQIIDP